MLGAWEGGGLDQAFSSCPSLAPHPHHRSLPSEDLPHPHSRSVFPLLLPCYNPFHLFSIFPLGWKLSWGQGLYLFTTVSPIPCMIPT